MASRKKLIRAVARTGVATLFGGPLGGLQAGARETVEILTDSPRKATADSILEGVAAGLDRLAAGEGLDERLVDQALDTSRLIVETCGSTVAECADLDFNATRIANRVMGRASALRRGLDPGVDDICRSVITRTYERLLADADVLPELDREFQRQVLTRLSGLAGLPAATAAVVRRLAAAALVSDPRLTWRDDMYSETALLRADFAVVPFSGRDETLAELTSWCRSGAPLALRLYTGAGGMGKTRLMIEACARMRAEGWTAGFLRNDADGRPLDDVFESGNVLIVVDYAERRREQLRELLAAALAPGRAGTARVVSLARSRGDWWARLASARGGVGDFVAGPGTSTAALAPLAHTRAERETAFEHAAVNFAARLGRPAQPLSRSLDGEHFDRVLFLHIAALATTLGEEVDGDRALLDFALARERHFWDAGIEAAGFAQLSGRPIAEAATLATLAGRLDTRQSALELIAQAPSLSGQPAAALNAVADLLHGLYPGDGWLEGVQPDLLGEHLMDRTVEDAPELLGVLDGG
jgi:hypothetical protein